MISSALLAIKFLKNPHGSIYLYKDTDLLAVKDEDHIS